MYLCYFFVKCDPKCVNADSLPPKYIYDWNVTNGIRSFS